MPEDETEENIQARIRGLLLMSAANKFKALLLTTGNKSEIAVGYCTLYGDTNGALAVLSDLYKTEVYKLAENINRENITIPNAIFYKAPSAELKPGQKDQDTLPPYKTLDQIIYLYTEKYLSEREIVKQVGDKKTVIDIIKRINRNEYKRKQLPPGIRITEKAFGIGRKIPIAKSDFNV
jgi:NAD+ synthase (glutamine-hydrolysing)